MKTDQIIIDRNGKGLAEVLAETEKAAVYCDLTYKQRLQLRLLAEEMTGMLRSIVGKCEAVFWIETVKKRFDLHLSARTVMDDFTYQALLKTATSGKNDAKKGFMSKLLDVILGMSMAVPQELTPLDSGYMRFDMGDLDSPMDVGIHTVMAGWSLETYRNSIKQRGETDQTKDELEHSIVAKLADEVKVFINGDAVETVIQKQFS